MANPCGLSYEKIVDILKNARLNKQSKLDVTAELMTQGLDYEEANEVANKYYSLYKENVKKVNKKDFTNFSEQEKNVAKAYLDGVSTNLEMTQQDWDNIQDLYDKAKKAYDKGAKNLAASYAEKASLYIAERSSDLTGEVFTAFLHIKPLTSVGFLINSIQSNAYQRWENSFVESIRTLFTHGYLDFRSLPAENKKFAYAYTKSLLGGAMPVSDALETDIGKSPFRPEYSKLSQSGFKGWYYKALQTWNKFGGKLINTPDTFALVANSERHTLQLYKEKYLQEGDSIKEATKKAYEAITLKDEAAARSEIDDLFTDLEIEKLNKSGNETSEYKLAVQEARRSNRETDIVDKAMLLSKNDLFKEVMTKPSDLGFIQTGLPGYLARGLDAIRKATLGDIHKAGTIRRVIAFNTFGYVNGAAAYLDKVLEAHAGYAAVKIIMGQIKKKGVTDPQIIADITRKQNQLVAKQFFVATSLLALQAVKKILEETICKGEGVDEIPKTQIVNSSHQFTICGRTIPMFFAPQLKIAYAWWDTIGSLVKGEGAEDEDIMSLAFQPFIMAADESRWGETKFSKLMGNIRSIRDANNEVQKTEIIGKSVKIGTDLALNYVNGFLPFPTRPIQEVGSGVNLLAKGNDVKQQDVVLSTDSKGQYTNMFNTIAKNGKVSLYNAIGITDWMNAFGIKEGLEAIDYQGRKIGTLRNMYLVGDGVQYNKVDEMYALTAVKPPYLSRYLKPESTDGEVEIHESILSAGGYKRNIDKLQYLTNDEFSVAAKATAKFYKEWWDTNYDKVKENYLKGGADKDFIIEDVKKISDVANLSKKVIAAIESGQTTEDGIYSYLVKKLVDPKKKINRTQKEFQE